MTKHSFQTIAITFDDGSIGIMYFLLDPKLPDGVVCKGYCPVKKRREATDAAVQAEIDKSAFDKKPVSWRRIAPEDIPANRTFRNAWRDRGHCIDHCMETCKNIHRDRLRTQRAPLLAALDVEYQRADEQDDKPAKKSIAARKQQLRDCTKDPRIDAASCIEELTAIKLEE